jgi:hypothetical protein
MGLYGAYLSLKNFDPTGQTILAEIGGGCAIGGMTSFGASIFVDIVQEKYDGMCCRAAGSAAEGCIVGGVTLALATKLPNRWGFAVGCLAGVVGKFVGDGVRWSLGCGDKVGLCDFVQALGSCLTSGLGGVKVETDNLNWLVQALVGFNLGVYGGLCSDGGVGSDGDIDMPINLTGSACCTFKSGSTGTIYNKNVSCAFGRPAMACCVEKARGTIFTASVLDARVGSCQ